MKKRLNDADGLSRAWFASLVYTPLFTRPVVLEMMREWIGHALKRKQMSKQEFLSHLDTIFVNQIKRLLSKGKMPSIIRGETAQEGYRSPFGDHPLLGHIAIYSINLILLRIVVADEPFDFDESQIGTYEDGARPWDRLTYIWRSWFSLDNLNGLTAVMLADRQDSKIKVQAKKKFQVAESQNRLETCLRVAISLGDNISSGLTGLLLFEPSKNNQLDIEDIARRLESERLDMELQIAMKRLLQNETHVDSNNAPEFMRAVNQALKMALKGNKIRELEHIALSLRRVMTRMRLEEWRGKLSDRVKYEFLMRDAIEPNLAFEVALLNPHAALVFFQLAKDIPDSEWIEYSIRSVFEWVFSSVRLLDLSERNPEAALALAQLVKEFGGERFLQRMDSEFFERAFDPRYLLELSRRNPEAALALIQMMKEFGGERFLQRMDSEFFERAFDPRRLLDLSRRNPEAALALVQLVKEFGAESILKRNGEELIDRLFNKFGLVQILRQKPTAFAVLLRLARITESPRATEMVLRYLISSLHQPNREGVSIETLPLTALSDLQWLAKTTANPEINSVLSRLLEETAPS